MSLDVTYSFIPEYQFRLCFVIFCLYSLNLSHKKLFKWYSFKTPAPTKEATPHNPTGAFSAGMGVGVMHGAVQGRKG